MSTHTQANTTTATDYLRIVSIVLTVVGLLVSGYISYTKLTDTSLVCAEGEVVNCDVVQNSVYSKLAGIEIAYLGFVAYLGIGVLLVVEQRVPFLQDYGRTLVFGITLFAFLYALWLIYVQAAILSAFCLWCLAHEVTITLLFIVSAVRLWQSFRI